MKLTSDKIFLDSNIIIYAHTDLDSGKQITAQQNISQYNTVISTQVLQESANTLVRKFKHSWTDIAKVVSEAIQNNMLHVNNEYTIRDAFRIAERYNFSFYDSLIISAAIESNCNILYSEDLHHGLLIDTRLKIVNPFV